MNRYVNHDILDKDNFEVKRWNEAGYDCNGKETYKLEDGKGIVENYHESFNGSCFLNFKGEYINGEKNGKGREYYRDGI